MPVSGYSQSRRFVLKGALGSAIAGMMPLAPACATEPAKHWVMIIDLNRCLGCQSCTMACRAESGAYSGVFNTRVLVDDSSASGKIAFLPAQCNHCDDPACAGACASGAIQKLSNGIVVTDRDSCMGDGACVAACPYAARALDKGRRNKADSCDFCVDRLVEGRVPACVEACSSGARVFGDAGALSGELAAYLAGASGKAQTREGLPAGRVFYVPLRKGGIDG